MINEWTYVDYYYTSETYDVLKQVRGIKDDEILRSFKREGDAHNYDMKKNIKNKYIMKTLKEVIEKFSNGSQVIKVEIGQYTYWFNLQFLSMERYFCGYPERMPKYYNNQNKFYESIKRILKKV